MKTQCSQLGRIVHVRLDMGDDILLALRQAVAQNGLKHALILGAMGSVTHYHVHVVDNSVLPPHDAFLKGEEPLDILSMNGVVMNGRVHAHISLSGEEHTFGGHVEEGCRVFTFCQAWLAEVQGIDLTDWDHFGKLP